MEYDTEKALQLVRQARELSANARPGPLGIRIAVGNNHFIHGPDGKLVLWVAPADFPLKEQFAADDPVARDTSFYQWARGDDTASFGVPALAQFLESACEEIKRLREKAR